MALTKEDLAAIASVVQPPPPDPAIARTLNQLTTDVALIRQAVTDNQQLATDIAKRIRGNGTPGIETRLDRVEQRWKTVGFLLTPVYLGIVGIVIKLWGG